MMRRRVVVAALVGFCASARGLANGAPQGLLPGDSVPEFELGTLSGRFQAKAVEGKLLRPVLLMTYEHEDPYCRSAWSAQASLQDFLLTAPLEADYLVVSAVADVASARQQVALLHASLFNRTFCATHWHRCNDLHPRLHFVTQTLGDLPEWMQQTLTNWTSSRKYLKAVIPGAEAVITPRADAWFTWIPWGWPQDPIKLIHVDDPCGPVPREAEDRVVLTPLPSGACSNGNVAVAVQGVGGKGVVLYAAQAGDVAALNCSGAECDLPIQIPMSIISYDAAQRIIAGQQEGGMRHQSESVEVSFFLQEGPGHFFGVSRVLQLEELGWAILPTLMHLTWAAQWMMYEQQLQEKLLEPADTVTVLDGSQSISGEHGLTTRVDLPVDPHQYIGLELEFALGCQGDRDVDCPQWDHVVQAFVCCDDPESLLPPCTPCSTTVWALKHVAWLKQQQEATLSIGGSDGAAIAMVSAGLNSTNVAHGHDTPLCGMELGRWITPFRRRVGHWLTDVTPLLALFTSQSCSITVQSAPWAGDWVPSLKLRFKGTRPAAAVPVAGSEVRLAPQRLVPLFEGGTFDEHYNIDHITLLVPVPSWMQKAEIVATITGHGESDDDNCAEFCPTSHHFRVNDDQYHVNFSSAGTLWGCTEQVLYGSVPSEHGTWFFGRNGWCDGQQVAPWVVDVTASVRQRPTATISYMGLHRDKEPTPYGQPGYIMMQSALVFYGITGEQGTHQAR